MQLPWVAPWWRSIFAPSVPLNGEARDRVASSLSAASYLNVDYIVLTVASSAIATFGLLENSPAVIIGAMIIAPLMGAIQALAYGAVEGASATFWRGVITLAIGAFIGIVVAAVLERCVGLLGFGTEILSRTRPNLLDLGIALAAGAVGGFARIRPSVANAAAGTAIAVALMPPLCVAGIGLAAGDWGIARGSMLLFVTNLIGITLASMLVFLVAGYARRRGRMALVWIGGLSALLVVPLTLSLYELIRESTVENVLRRALTEQTVTFRQATLVSSRFDWLSRPPTATLLVRSREMLSPHQVALLEAFAHRATGQSFHFVIDVSQIERVTDAGPEDLEQPSALGPQLDVGTP
jgi:uncharacterized hydrophobic protein (TIGR00271 family)